jgi:uncharacterized membrane protein YfcA
MTEMFTIELLYYILLGLAAQLVDGALGMAYGLITTSVLLATGTAPAVASASVHAAEVVTTGLASASHAWHKNIDWKLFARLAPAGVAGGVIGAYVLVGLPENFVKIFITIYLIGMTVLITRRVMESDRKKQPTKEKREKTVPTSPVGGVGGFLDAVGGGGWGPLVTSTLLARGDNPRKTIGSVTASEFFLTVAVSVAFVLTLNWRDYAQLVLGLVIGGAIAAPMAGYLSKILPPKVLMTMVAVVVTLLALANILRLLFGSAS